MVNDSHRYFEYAEDLSIHGFYIDRHNIWYFSYVLLVFCFSQLNISLFDLVTFQALLQGFAIFCLAKSLHTYFNNKAIGFWFAILMIAWVKIGEWNFYIMTESFFISLSMISLAVLLRSEDKPKLRWLLLPLLIITFFCRPMGLGFLICVLVFFFVKIYQTQKNKKWLNAIMVVTLIIQLSTFYLLLNTMLHTFDMIDVYERAELVYAYGTISNPAHPHLLLIEKPTDFYIPSEDYKQLDRVILFIINNPWFYFKLSIGKIFYFLGNIKPYFSWYHNAAIIAFLYPVYYFFVSGIRRVKDRLNPLKWLVLSYVIFNTAIVIAATEDWDGRFLLPVLPLIFIFTAHQLSNKWRLRN